MKVRYKAFLIAAGVMILLFVIGGKFGFRTASAEPRTHVMAFDTTTIILIEFVDFADRANNFELARVDNGWDRHAARTFPHTPGMQARELLHQFHDLPVKRDMGMIGLVGERFGLTSATWSRISFVQADAITHSLYLGNTTFAPGRVGAWTYVNVPDERIVYAVEGLLTAGLRPGSDDL
jgi:hypothetical protein